MVTNLWIRTDALPLLVALRVTIPVQRPPSGQKRYVFILSELSFLRFLLVIRSDTSAATPASTNLT